MQALAFGLAGCMSMDLVHILRKGRLNLTGLKADLTGHRTSQTPHRFLSVDLHFTVIGNLPADQIQRAIDLSREKYLFRLALDAPGHRAQRHLRGHDRRLTALHASLEIDTGARSWGSGARSVRPGFSRRRAGRFQRIPKGLPRLGPGHRRPRHDRSARRRQLDGGARSVQQGVRLGDGRRGIRRAALPAARRCGSLTLGRIQSEATRRHARGLPRGDASRAGNLPARVRLQDSSVDSGLVVAAVPASS